ncbi:hypothetical protein BR93DRAFT_998044 [Coniochaeta sp. PMI_546]|nr:hypothetical protein BR93DRAFT_998044 [Coniochaeta sp. PMI_546]
MSLPGLRIGTTVDPTIGHLTARQFVDDDGLDDSYVPFWYTRTGIIVKWSLFLGIVILFSAYLFIGYTHAKKRIARGLPPLAYHRWLVSRGQLASVDPRYAYPAPAGFATYRPPQNEYGMYAMPPPVYDPNAPRPPMYYGPTEQDVGTKVDPDQSRPAYQQPTVTEEYEAPAGPPPSAVRPQGTGNSNPFRN